MGYMGLVDVLVGGVGEIGLVNGDGLLLGCWSKGRKVGDRCRSEKDERRDWVVDSGHDGCRGVDKTKLDF